MKNYLQPPKEKSVSEKCREYVYENPSTVAKGAAGVAVAWYTVPVILSAVSWLPAIGAGYYIYTQSKTVEKSYSWYQSAKEWREWTGL